MAYIVFGTITAIVGIGSLILAFVTIARNKKIDDKTEGEKGGALHADIGYIKKGIDGIERRLDAQENRYIDVIKKLTDVEASVKSAHKRIDELAKYHEPNQGGI